MPALPPRIYLAHSIHLCFSLRQRSRITNRPTIDYLRAVFQLPPWWLPFCALPRYHSMLRLHMSEWVRLGCHPFASRTADHSSAKIYITRQDWATHTLCGNGTTYSSFPTPDASQLVFIS